MPVTLPPPARAALLLDIDGTLLDLAATPGAVVVPPGLLDTLRRLRRHLGDALAVVTGRPLEQVDLLLADAPFAAAGEHGGVIRHAPRGTVVRPPLRDVPDEWFAEAERLVAAHPGSLFERKRRGFVLHYRLAPEAGGPLGDGALALVATDPEHFQLQPAAMAWEVRPFGVDKGLAVTRLCAEPPFAGRLPLFIGDDVTDEDGIRAADAMGGAGLLVGPAFGTPASVRAWLRASADRLDAGETDWAPLTDACS